MPNQATGHPTRLLPVAALALAMTLATPCGTLHAAPTAPTATSAPATPPASGASYPIANVIMGGGEPRCSSYTGSAQSRNCLADWNTILAQDPAFEGMTADDISFEPNYPQPAFTYSLTPSHLDALRHVPERLFNRTRKYALLARLQQLLQDTAPQDQHLWQHHRWEYLQSQFTPPTQRLSAAENAILRSVLVDAMPATKRKLEARSIPFSSNAASRASIAAFVAAARAANGGHRPLIGVVTASAGPHPFADRDINVFALRSAGAEAVYLPLNGGFRQALDADDCANARYYYDSYHNPNPERMVYHADLQFPDLAQQQIAYCKNHGQALNALLNRLNGIYFSGGNQARHLDSLVTTDAEGNYTRPSEQIRILQRRYAQGQLVVGGTSAGDQFQGGGTWRGKPVPMIGGGDSYSALKRGFDTAKGPATAPGDQPPSFAPVLYPQGGLGTFRYGVLDSHFSRRVREGRLLRATFDSGMDYGFGIDENTALLVSHPDANGTTHFSVLGDGGVFMADVRQAQASTTATATTPQHQHPITLDGIRAHYLLPGDTATIDAAGALQVTLNPAVPLLPPAAQPTTTQQDRLLDYGSYNFLNLATAMGRNGAWLGYGTTENSASPRIKQNDPYYSVTLVRDGETVFRGAAVGASAGETNAGAGPVAYTGVRVRVAPCVEVCRLTAPADMTVK